jgi:hypothetical protein
MFKFDDPVAKYRKQARELRIEAAKWAGEDSVMRETLLKAAEACERLAKAETSKAQNKVSKSDARIRYAR